MAPIQGYIQSLAPSILSLKEGQMSEANMKKPNISETAATIAEALMKPKGLAERYPLFQWQISESWSEDSISWDAPTSFVIYSDGSWALSIAKVTNGYDSYGMFDRHFSVRFLFLIDYYNADGSVVHQFKINAGEAGYKASIDNIFMSGVDIGFNKWKEQIVEARAFRRKEPFY
jgi:hypothetical protein